MSLEGGKLYVRILGHNMHRLQVAGILLAGALAFGTAGFALADNDNDNSGKGKGSVTSSLTVEERTLELKAHIKGLQDQIQAMLNLQIGLQTNKNDRKTASTTEEKKDLRQDMKDIMGDMRDVRSNAKAEVKFIRSLTRGMSGDDVRDLQELLAQDPSIYPEGLITGFFGPATERAMKKFQKKHGLEQAGIFGPRTRALIHKLFEGKWPPGILKHFGIFASTTGTTTPGSHITICHYPPGNSAAKQTLTIGIAALAAHLIHGDRLGACDTGTATTTPPTADTAAPTISAISAGSVSASTSVIVWTTNEPASSAVWYGTTTPVSASSPTLSSTNASLVTAHSINLSGLSASTTQYFVVESKDAANNTATSSTQSFITLP